MNEKQPTKIRQEINPNSFFYPVVRFWNDYFVFYVIYWRAAIFILLAVSLYFLWPYAPLIVGDAGGQLTIPVQPLVGNQDNMTGYPVGIANDAIVLIVEAPKYVAPNRKADFNFYLKQTSPIPADNQKVIFKVIPVDTSMTSSETVLVKATQGIWQATSNFPVTLSASYPSDAFKFTIQVESKPDCPEEQDPQSQPKPECAQPPITLELKDLQIPVVRWPTYIVQFLVFIAALGFFGISQIGPAFLSIFFSGGSEKKK